MDPGNVRSPPESGVFLQSFGKLLQASVIGCGVVPEAGMSGIGHHANFCRGNANHLLINDS